MVQVIDTIKTGGELDDSGPEGGGVEEVSKLFSLTFPLK
jgi:hypothetical protein